MTPDITATPTIQPDHRQHAPKVDWATPITPEPAFAALDRAVARFPSRPYLNFMGRVWTYAEAGALIDRAAKGFQKMGVRKGVTVGLCLPNCPNFTIAYFAIMKAGGTVVNFNPLYVEREIAYQVRDANIRIMVTLDLKQIYPKVKAVMDDPSTPLERIVVCPMRDILPPVKSVLFSVFKRSELAVIDNDLQHASFAQVLDNDGVFTPVAIDPVEDVAVLQYTGGTTGVPKGAMLTHANLSANMEQARRWFPGVREGEEKVLAVIPFFHVFAMTAIQNFGTAAGAELILLPRFELDQFLKTVHKHQPTLMAGVPTLFTAILNAPDREKYDLSSFRFCISGGAPLPVEVKHRFEELTGCSLVEGYGLSESSPLATCNPIDGPSKDGSIGIPVPGTRIEIHCLEYPDRVVEQGQKGEVCIVGPQVMKGYHNRPEDTAKTIVDGRLHTGDVGYIDGDGFVFLVDRIKDVILAGGYNVYPRVIEEALYLHPDIAEVVCIGIPDQYRGQAPKCFVRLKTGTDAVSPEDLKAFLGDKVSRIEMPKAIEIRDELPKTMVGKLSKKELVAEEQKKFEAASRANAPL